MHKSKMLVVSERYWPDGGGGELATHLIVDVLRREFDVTVVTGSKNPVQLPGVEYAYEPLLSKWEKPILWFNTLRLVKTSRFEKLLRESDILYVPRFAFPVIPYAKKMGKAVVVHLHDYIPVSYTATVLAPYEEHRHRITRDDIALECMKGTKHCMAVNLLWWLPRLARKWITQADKIICVSKRQAEIISDLAPELGSKIGVIYNPPPPELVRARPSKDLNDTPTYLYVGGDGHVKGFYISLRIAKELEKKKIKTGLILAGDYDSENLRILENFNTRSKYVKAIVVGKVIREELISLHNKSWALFFPSICEEALGYAVVEASLLGTIPVASRVGGVAEILSDTLISNFMFAPNNVAEAVEKCSAICMLSPSEVKNLGYELRSEVLKKFGPDTIKQELLDFFNDVLHS